MLATIGRALRHLLLLIDTTVHELGHVASMLPFGTILRIRVSSDAEGHAESYGAFSIFFLHYPVRILNLFSGYAAPILLGLFILLAAPQESLPFSGYWFGAVALWLIAGIALTATEKVEITVTPILAGSLLAFLAVGGAPNPLNVYTMSGTGVVFFVLGTLCAVLVLSVRSWLTLLFAVLWVVGISVMGSLISTPETHAAGMVALFTFAALLLISGIVSVVEIGMKLNEWGGNDFDDLSEELFGGPMFWYVLFIIHTLGCAALMVWFFLFA